MVRATDMFMSLTRAAADGITEHAKMRKQVAASLRAADAHINDGPTKTHARALADGIDREAAAWERFAAWLRGPAGEKGGDDAATPRI